MKDTPEVLGVGALAADMKDTPEVVGALVAEALSETIIRAVNNSESAYGLPSASDLK